MGWTWRVGMLVARHHCPTLGERAARSAGTSYFSTVAPTTRAAWHPCLHPTWVVATPIPISITTMPSASWTAASASCRSQRTVTDQHQQPWTNLCVLPVLPSLFHTVTQNQYQWSDGFIVCISLHRKKWAFLVQTLLFLLLYFIWFVSWIHSLLVWNGHDQL